MAITSRTAAARAQPQQHVLSNEDDFLNFMDFTFSEEGDENRPIMDITEAIHGSPTFQFTEFPSPIPLHEIKLDNETNANANIITNTLHPAAKTKQTKLTYSTTIAPDISTSITARAYNDGPNTTTRPKPEDVLSVRGVGHSKNPGNLKFRELVISSKGAYDRNTNPDARRLLAIDIVAKLQPGRFLKKADTTQRVYQIMDYESSVTKALFAIRDVKPGAVKRSAKAKVPPKSNLVKGKRKRKAQLQATNSDSGSQARTTRRKKSTKNQIPSCLLSESELEKIEKMICDSTSRKDVPCTGTSTAATAAVGSMRSDQIFARIELTVSKGVAARRKVSELTSNPVDQEWFDSKRQKEIKKSLLGRCKIAMSTGMSFTDFFTKFDANVFREVVGDDDKR